MNNTNLTKYPRPAAVKLICLNILIISVEEVPEDDVEEIKQKLKNYFREDISFNEPHFTQQLLLREGSREQVIGFLLNPDKLVYSYEEKGRGNEVRHCLHFKLSNNRTLRIPVIFDKNGEKGLYILTYIMRYRRWQNMIKRA